MYCKIHVNTHKLRKRDPEPFIIRVYKSSKYKTEFHKIFCQELFIQGSTTLLYNYQDPLSCGGKAWIEVDLDMETYIEYKNAQGKWQSLTHHTNKEDLIHG